jgi:hypothetical protein
MSDKYWGKQRFGDPSRRNVVLRIVMDARGNCKSKSERAGLGRKSAEKGAESPASDRNLLVQAGRSGLFRFFVHFLFL